MIEWVVDRPGLRLGIGDCAEYDGDADLVFTHPYGPLPLTLIGKPAVINLVGDRKAAAEAWCSARLHAAGEWGRGCTNMLYCANMSAWQFPVGGMVEEEIAPGRGWFPRDLPRAVLSTLKMHGALERVTTVWDGFMGRGTVGKAVLELGLGFVGIDRDPARVALAREYLGC